ncbi:epoxide hydrolase hyl1 [Leucosporidium creatinivorum]|uniref:Epoxide hydrolase hyl1 n=1 Tax=Leucosporidium creatinivorum TaxID=106004 RepID=A0A1Y2FY74_9BASI|nr:epoxide hydrolase hyl1 [Leucosporidium creatinivorum]
MPYDKLPTTTTIPVEPFQVSIPDAELEELHQLLRLGRLAPPTYENAVQQEGQFGVTREWMSSTRDYWVNEFDWRKQERYINSFLQYTATVDGYKIHFAALLSEKKDAIPLLLLHGWPGSFLEFLPILDLLKEKYTPQTLPYNLIVPSLPGYFFSSPPPLDSDFGSEDIAQLLHRLMLGLGFESYAAQGGDIGAKAARILGVTQEACQVVHLNDSFMQEPKTVHRSALTDAERVGRERADEFLRVGAAYARMQATRPSTLGFALSSNPLSLLAWVGEKLLAWSDEDLTIDTSLTLISLWWFTDSISTSFYPYRQVAVEGQVDTAEDPRYQLTSKPFGYSWFAKDLAPVPQAWVATSGDLRIFKAHMEGGHFAALEKPAVLLADIEEFLAQEWKV